MERVSVVSCCLEFGHAEGRDTAAGFHPPEVTVPGEGTFSAFQRPARRWNSVITLINCVGYLSPLEHV